MVGSPFSPAVRWWCGHDAYMGVVCCGDGCALLPARVICLLCYVDLAYHFGECGVGEPGLGGFLADGDARRGREERAHDESGVCAADVALVVVLITGEVYQQPGLGGC